MHSNRTSLTCQSLQQIRRAARIVVAFLDASRTAKSVRRCSRRPINGYNVLVGSTPANPLTFPSYADHPNVFDAALDSTAAGRYQLLHMLVG